MTPYILHRDARMIELDMLTLIEENYPKDHNFIPLFKKLSDRIGKLADDLQQLEELEKEIVMAAERWKLLHETDNITWADGANRISIFRELPQGLKLLASGLTLTEAANKALGFK